MKRREFIRSVGVGTLAVLGGSLLRVWAEEKPKAPPSPKPRPPGACGGWTDSDGDGCCDRSVQEIKPCGRTACPGHAKNPSREKLVEAGAPQGVCALWKDSEKTGQCEWSRKIGKSACSYLRCPAHKDYRPPVLETPPASEKPPS